MTTAKIAVTQKAQGIQRFFNLLTVKDRIITIKRPLVKFSDEIKQVHYFPPETTCFNYTVHSTIPPKRQWICFRTIQQTKKSGSRNNFFQTVPTPGNPLFSALFRYSISRSVTSTRHTQHVIVRLFQTFINVLNYSIL